MSHATLTMNPADNNSDMSAIRWNPKDLKTIKFLESIGLRPEDIKKGRIDEFECSNSKIASEALFKLAELDGKESNCLFKTCYLSPEEAGTALKLMERHGEKNIAGLFKYDRCMSPQGVGRDILSNISEKKPSNVRGLGGMVGRAVCPYEHYRAGHPQEHALLGIMFDDKTAPRTITGAGKAVVEIKASWKEKIKGKGSAVVISNDGIAVTARHVLYDKKKTGAEIKDVFDGRLYVEKDGKKYPITKEHIVREDKEKDTVILRIPELAGHPHIPVAASEPKKGEPVWLIGYPMTFNEDTRRLYTTGVTTEFHQKEGKTVTTARATHGFSGGAMTNAKGELIGVISFITGNRLRNILPMGDANSTAAYMVPLKLK